MSYRSTGITPAQAGKSGTTRSRSSRKQDHPRAGGEKVFVGVAYVFRHGSPPRRRGKEPPTG